MTSFAAGGEQSIDWVKVRSREHGIEYEDKYGCKCLNDKRKGNGVDGRNGEQDGGREGEHNGERLGKQ